MDSLKSTKTVSSQRSLAVTFGTGGIGSSKLMIISAGTPDKTGGVLSIILKSDL